VWMSSLRCDMTTTYRNFWPNASRIAWLVWMSSLRCDMTTTNRNLWPSASRIAWLVWMSSLRCDMTTHVRNGVKIRVQMSPGNVSVFCTLILTPFLINFLIKPRLLSPSLQVGPLFLLFQHDFHHARRHRAAFAE